MLITGLRLISPHCCHCMLVERTFCHYQRLGALTIIKLSHCVSLFSCGHFQHVFNQPPLRILHPSLANGQHLPDLRLRRSRGILYLFLLSLGFFPLALLITFSTNTVTTSMILRFIIISNVIFLLARLRLVRGGFAPPLPLILGFASLYLSFTAT